MKFVAFYSGVEVKRFKCIDRFQINIKFMRKYVKIHPTWLLSVDRLNKKIEKNTPPTAMRRAHINPEKLLILLIC